MLPHRNELVEISRGRARFLNQQTWIQCFFKLGIVSESDFREKELAGIISYQGDLPQFLSKIVDILPRSELLSAYDIELALHCLGATV